MIAAVIDRVVHHGEVPAVPRGVLARETRAHAVSETLGKGARECDRAAQKIATHLLSLC